MSKVICEINIDQFCADLGLEKMHGEQKFFALTDVGINRPGLQLHGYYEYFDEGRIQLVGKVEMSYLMGLTEGLRQKRIDDFFSRNIPCFIVCWDHPDWAIFLEASKKHNRILLKSPERTSTLIYRLVDYVDQLSAPSIRIHGVLVEVYGVGVLLRGHSGIGKSEVALELIERGAAFIADDAVDVFCYQGRMLRGEAPESLRYFMEVRGVGIIDVQLLFGTKSIKESESVDLIIDLEDRDQAGDFDRLGLDDDYVEILGVSVPRVKIPVSVGRDLAAIIETATINSRLKAKGIRPEQRLMDRISAEHAAITAKKGK